MSNHAFYDTLAIAAGFLDEGLSRGEARMVEHLRERGGVVLDVGCGSGRLHAELETVDFVLGVDYAATQLAVYHDNPPTAALVRGDAKRLPCVDERFDSVLMGYHMIESLLPASAQHVAVAESARVLKTGGHLCLTRHVRRNYRRRQQIYDFATRRVDRFGDLVGRGGNRAGGVSLAGFSMHVPSEAALRNAMSTARLEPVDAWDFDTGERRRRDSRAVVEVYRKAR